MARRRQKKARARRPEPEAPAPRKPFTDEHDWLPWAFALLALVTGTIAFDSRLALSGDNAEFIILGKSVAEGHGLSYVHTPEMTPATKYPFGFPLLLAVVHTILPHSVLAMKLLVFFCFVAAVPLFYRYLLPETGMRLAGLVAAITATSHFVVDYSHQVMSEVPYTFVSVVALLCLAAALREPSNRSLAIAVVTVMASYYLRTIGIALVAAGIAAFVLQRRYREAGLFGGGCLLLAIPWQIRTSLLGGESYAATWLFRVDPYRPERGEIGWFGLVGRFFENIQIYFIREFPVALYPAWITNFIPILIGGILGLCVLYFLVAELRQRSLTGLYLGCYLGACFLWPKVWTDLRLVLPVLPLVFLAVLVSVRDLVGRFAPARAGLAATVVALTILASNLHAVGIVAAEEHRYPPSFSTYFEAARWLEQNAEPDAVVACRKAFLMSIISKRKTISYELNDDFDAVLAGLERGGADYVVVDQLSFNSTSRYLIPTIERHRERFRLAHVVPDPDTYILRFD